MAEENSLGVIREFLEKAFDDKGLNKLAYDRFNEIYQDIASKDHSQKAIDIVGYADRQGRIDEVIDYVKAKNKYQYNKYKDRLPPRYTQEENQRPDGYEPEKSSTPATTETPKELSSARPPLGCSIKVTLILSTFVILSLLFANNNLPVFTSTETPEPVTLTPSPTSPINSSTPTITPVPTTTGTPSAFIDVRKGPGRLFEVIGRMQEGQEVVVQAQYTNREGETWYQVQLANEQEGWFFSGSIAPDPLHNLKPPNCFYEGSTVEETLSNLVNAEGEAVEKEDITIIFLIFGRNAQITRADTPPETWRDVMQYYQEKFANEEHFRVDHGSLNLQLLTAEGAFAITDSSGEWMWEQDLADVPLPTPMTYTNPAGSDHWTFARNDSGCWVINDFTYNASHITPTP
jgi:hypothetical protein